MTNEKTKVEIGDSLDGMVVFHIDSESKTALLTLKNVFGGRATFGRQDDVVKSARKRHKQNDLRLGTDAELSIMARNWEQFAPPKLQDLDGLWFWGAGSNYYYGQAYRAGGDSIGCHQTRSMPVPVVRSVALP